MKQPRFGPGNLLAPEPWPLTSSTLWTATMHYRNIQIGKGSWYGPWARCEWNKARADWLFRCMRRPRIRQREEGGTEKQCSILFTSKRLLLAWYPGTCCPFSTPGPGDPWGPFRANMLGKSEVFVQSSLWLGFIDVGQESTVWLAYNGDVDKLPWPAHWIHSILWTCLFLRCFLIWPNKGLWTWN